MNNLGIDHIYHKVNDNRKENLRIATQSQNMFNRKGTGKMSEFGLKGIVWSKINKKWRSRIMKDNRTIYSKMHENIVEAISDKIEAEKTHFGEYRYEWENDIKWSELLAYEREIKVTN